jgi:F1F0 ATPase subunit 2
MNEIFTLILSLLAGASLGVLYFVGLWWTVQKTVSSSHPALLIFGSLLIRTGMVLTGFYFMSGTHLMRLFFCLLGFVATRTFIVKRVQIKETQIHAHQS